MFQSHPPILHTEQRRQQEHPSQSQPTQNPETHPVPQSLATLGDPHELMSAVRRVAETTWELEPETLQRRK